MAFLPPRHVNLKDLISREVSLGSKCMTKALGSCPKSIAGTAACNDHPHVRQNASLLSPKAALEDHECHDIAHAL